MKTIKAWAVRWKYDDNAWGGIFLVKARQPEGLFSPYAIFTTKEEAEKAAKEGNYKALKGLKVAEVLISFPQPKRKKK